MEVSQGSNQPPPGPPGPGATPIMVGVGGGKAPKMVPVRKTAKGLRTRGSAAARHPRDDMIIDPTKGPPGPEPVPAGMAPPPHQGPPPPPSRPKIKAKNRFLKADQAKVRAALLANLKAVREQKKENSTPKLEPTPQPEKLETKRAASEPRAAAKPRAASREPSAQPPAAKARAKSRSSSRNPPGKASSASAAAETQPTSTRTSSASVGKPSKKERTSSKSVEKPLEVIVARAASTSKPARGRSSTPIPAYDPFGGVGQRLAESQPPRSRSRINGKQTPASSSTAASSSSAAPSAAAPAETYATPSKLTSQTKIIENMIKVAEDPRFDKEDAATVANIIAEIDTTDKELRKTMIERLKEIYQRDYHRMKNDKKSDKKK